MVSLKQEPNTFLQVKLIWQNTVFLSWKPIVEDHHQLDNKDATKGLEVKQTTEMNQILSSPKLCITFLLVKLTWDEK